MSEERFDLLVLGGGVVGLWTAREAARAGLRVGVVECGPALLEKQRDARPALRFPERDNLGAVRARNHVLTGNSSYWGGGLVRNPRGALEELFGPRAGAVAAEYPAVEQSLGVAKGFAPAALEVHGAALHEIAVLPGKKRGLWYAFAEPGVTLLTERAVCAVERGPRGVESVTVRDASGAEQTLRAERYALCLGAVDSNLFALRFLLEGMPAEARAAVGTRLHDHWSLPVCALKWRAGPAVDPLFPPKFRAGIVAGRRLTLERGFFHVVSDLDVTPPYDKVKAFLRVRQQGAGLLAVTKAALGTMASPLKMARAGVHYVFKRELHIPDGSEVRLVYDFESSRSERNRLVLEGEGAALHWDLREEDYAHFARAVRERYAFWRELWGSARVDARWLFDVESEESAATYLREHAIDAYHLGGGLHPSAGGAEGPSEEDGTLRGWPNLFVNGTAFFGRPGPANPVLTLLARATVYVRELSGRGR